VTLAGEAAQAFGPELPPDARLMRLPPWVTLEGVWGSYDPPLVGDYGGLVQVTFAGDRGKLLLLGRQGQLFVWDRDERAIRGRIDACAVPRHDDAAHLVVTSSDGLAAVGFVSGRYCVADLSTGKMTATIEANDLTRGCGVGVMVARLAAGRLTTYGYAPPACSAPPAVLPTNTGPVSNPERGGELRSWDARTGKRLSDAAIGGASLAALSPEGERLAVVPRRSEMISDDLRLIDRAGQVLWSRRVPVDRGVQQVVFATSDTLLATDGDQLFAMSARDGALLGFFEAQGPLTGPLYPQDGPGAAIAVTPDGRHAITNLNGRTVLWDVSARREVARATRRNENELRFIGFRDLAFSPDGSLFASTSAGLVSTSSLGLLDSPAGPVAMLAVSSDAQHAIAWRRRRRTKELDVWDADTRSLRRWPGPYRPGLMYEPSALAVASDGMLVAIRASDFVELREWSSGRALWSIPNDQWATMDFSPDGRSIATFVWDRSRGHFRTTLRETATGSVLWQNEEERPQSGALMALMFAPSGQTLVLPDADNRLVVLDARDGSVVRRVGPTEAGTWALAGEARALVIGEHGRSVAGYDLGSGKPLWRSQEGREASGGAVRVAAWPDGRAFLEVDGSLIRKRSVDTGAELGEPLDLEPSADAPACLALSSDGETLVVGTRRGVLLRLRSKE
jgi:WD40 repeat protein